MPTTDTIPLTTLAANQVVTIPTRSISGVTEGTFSIDRTAGASSLNSLAQGQNALILTLEFSRDGGVTFNAGGSTQTLSGGIFHNRDGTQDNISAFSVFPPADANAVHGSVTALKTVSIQGTLTTLP